MANFKTAQARLESVPLMPCSQPAYAQVSLHMNILSQNALNDPPHKLI